MKAAILIASLTLSLCPSLASARSVHVYVNEAPPPPREEVVRPRHGYVWVGGHHAYRHHGYVWSRGHYAHERRGREWHDGNWDHSGDRYEWHEGGWR
jgi:hypothetical protein